MGVIFSLKLQEKHGFLPHKHEKCRICLVDKFGIFLVGEGGFARLRAGRVAALTCHRHVIHYRSLRIHLYQTKNPSSRMGFLLGGGRWIRTTEGIASRFTVCPLWPLGNSPIFCFRSLPYLRAEPSEAGLRRRRRSSGGSETIRSLLRRGGAGGRTRTPDLLITNQLLYQLSYTSIEPA